MRSSRLFGQLQREADLRDRDQAVQSGDAAAGAGKGAAHRIEQPEQQERRHHRQQREQRARLVAQQRRPDQLQVLHAAGRSAEVGQRALVQMQDAAREFRRLRIVRHHDDGLAVVAIELLQQRQHFRGRLAVEVAGGLIAHQQRRVRHDGARDGHALLLAAGQFAGLCTARSASADELQRDVGALPALRRRTGASAAAAARRSCAPTASRAGCRTETRSRRGRSATWPVRFRTADRCARRRP